MALRSAPLLLLVLVAVALREGYFGTSSHSLMFFSTVISEPSQGLPQFVSVGSVDGQVFAYYDSNTRRVQPRVSWIEKVGKEDPQYWDRNTQRVRYSEVAFRDILETVRRLYNQSEGLHTWQRMDGCELRGNKSKGGFEQHGYDGRTFLTFDKETLTWVAPVPQARITQRKWDALPGYNQRTKFFLEEFCIEWLEKYLSYGKETLLRTEPKSNLGLIIGYVVVGLVLMMCAIVGILVFLSKYPFLGDGRKMGRFLPSLSLWGASSGLPPVLLSQPSWGASEISASCWDSSLDSAESEGGTILPSSALGRGIPVPSLSKTSVEEQQRRISMRIFLPSQLLLLPPFPSLHLGGSRSLLGQIRRYICILKIFLSLLMRQSDCKISPGVLPSREGEIGWSLVDSFQLSLIFVLAERRQDDGTATSEEKGKSPCWIQAGKATQSLHGGAWPPLEEREP
ncbi:class I histocompatibility antigen, F10 alpha chain-like isoform X2 [Crotalus tigris]|uniref:class I histocompatibility antigen, F10 alpha chain-like isoform X2 n=1 Tax=Crotalus tigris TaxID=88082 RepID=UPI00192F82EC|nr:class I histocompatibility antigen, F10 alpha chain-like isoform X2 [Crotalus tigris]